MEASVAQRGQITLPKEARDALGLVAGTKLIVQVEAGRIILRKDVSAAITKLRGSAKLLNDMTTNDVMRELRGRAPDDPVQP